METYASAVITLVHKFLRLNAKVNVSDLIISTAVECMTDRIQSILSMQVRAHEKAFGVLVAMGQLA